MGRKHFRGDSVTLAATVAFATVRGKPPRAKAVTLEAASATLEAITVGLGPRIEKVLFYDASAALGSRWTDKTKDITDRNTSTDSGAFLNEWQTGDRIYIGCKRRFRGLAVDIGGANTAGTANSVGEYPNPQAAWTDLSITDGTDSTRTLEADGLITWTVPITWAPFTLKEATRLVVDGNDAPTTDKLFWVRLRPDAALTDTSVDIDELVALLNTIVDSLTPEAEGYALVRIASGNKAPYLIELGEDIGGIELVSASITSACLVNWLEDDEGKE